MSEAAYSYSEDREDYEIINGQVYKMFRSVPHNLIQGNILTAFKNCLKGKPCRSFGKVDVFLDDNNNVVPDFSIVCNPDIIK